MIGAVAGLDSSTGQGTEPDLLARLAELCADLPLALAVVARKIAARPGLAGRIHRGAAGGR